MKADRAKLLESSITIKSNLERQVQELRSQLEKERAERKDLDEEFWNLDGRWVESQNEVAKLQAELSDLKQKSAAASKDLPEAADLLNQLKTRRKKSSSSLADVELILEMIEES
ncbi:hypothetical protein AVDCRST_MAG94-5402 [uncultured Leptolyngbya sp.]|uniref:Uncharacterized protein n=1 Tax=uncultured Leptolyngbya sp. TaxID=332963 RepID=A0A6J4NLL4_9CYAN|nr:hypothetical protein AVDCRST_MAG94-5402 [uncultured Leptolyngbya sp.]